jgi:hypothetical protein
MSQEYDFFNNPHISKLLDLVLQLAAEVHVSNQRIRVLQMQLERQGLLQVDAIDYFSPDTFEQNVLDASREAMTGRLMRIIAEAGPAEFPLRAQWEEQLENRLQK